MLYINHGCARVFTVHVFLCTALYGATKMQNFKLYRARLFDFLHTRYCDFLNNVPYVFAYVF